MAEYKFKPYFIAFGKILILQNKYGDIFI